MTNKLIKQLPIDQFKQTSAYQKNCVFNSGANLIVARLLSATTDELNKAAPMFAWKDSFIEYYGLPKSTTLLTIKNIFAAYPNEQDQQIILGAALRHYLKTLVLSDEAVKSKLFSTLSKTPDEISISGVNDTFLQALNDFLIKNGNVNAAFFKKHRLLQQACIKDLNETLHSYQMFCARHALDPQADSSVTVFLKTFENGQEIEQKIKSAWMNNYSHHYANLLGKAGEFLDIQEGMLVYNKLGISLNVYSPINGELIDAHKAKQETATLNVMTKGFNHFENFAETPEELAAHKQNYAGSTLRDLTLHASAEKLIQQQVQQKAHQVAEIDFSDEEVKLPGFHDLIDMIETQKDAPKEVVYSYIRNDVQHFFKTSRANQIALDKALARAIQECEVDFVNLPRADNKTRP